MTQKKTSELVVEEMDVVNTAEVSDDSANAEDAPAVALNEENEIEDNLPPAVDYLDPTLFCGNSDRSIRPSDLNPISIKISLSFIPITRPVRTWFSDILDIEPRY